MMVDWLSLRVNFEEHEQRTVLLCRDEKSVEVACRFLVANEIADVGNDKFPALPLPTWNCPSKLKESLRDVLMDAPPILFGDSSFEITEDGSAKLGLDVFGSAFFMLSRYEERASAELDEHRRYSGSTSFSYRAGLLSRPIIDEYFNILIASMSVVWPEFQLECRRSEIKVSCDVDEPFERWIRDPMYLAKGIAGALVRRRSLSIACRRLMNGIYSPFENFKYDPYWNFDWYMQTCEDQNRKAQFYFLAQPGPRDVDAAYELESKRIQRLLAQIHSRGHVIGLHGSYDSYISGDLLAAERQSLQNACETAGVKQEILHSRQHYLRWRSDITPDCQAAAGLRFDSTVGFADMPGFRCGTARSFRMWSWKELAPLALEQQPLILMEGTLTSGVYLPQSEEIAEVIQDYKERSQLTGGDFTLLWHNSSLTNERDRQLFKLAVQ